MEVSIVFLRNSTRNRKAKNVISILHSSFYILHFLKYHISEESKEVSDEALPYDDEKGIASAKFTTDGCHCCDTRSVEQAEDEEGCSSGGGQDAADAHSCAEEHAQCAHHALLGKEAGDKRCADAPVAKAKR